MSTVENLAITILLWTGCNEQIKYLFFYDPKTILAI